ncbi:MAG: hypothetical protein ACLVB5_14115 [Christensenellales bacterium]
MTVLMRLSQRPGICDTSLWIPILTESLMLQAPGSLTGKSRETTMRAISVSGHRSWQRLLTNVVPTSRHPPTVRTDPVQPAPAENAMEGDYGCSHGYFPLKR